MNTIENTPVKGVINYKSFAGSVKDVDTQKRIVTGYYAAFDNIDYGMDRLRKGCASKTINERGPNGKNNIFHLIQHNWLAVAGKPQVLKEDDYGVYFETKFEDTTAAKDALILYEAQVYKEHSIGFSYIDWKSVYEDQALICWDVTELKLYEGSTVAEAMNPAAIFTGLKSNVPEYMAGLLKELDVCMAVFKQGALSDDTLYRAEMRYKQIQEELKTIPLLEQRPPQAPPKQEPDYSELLKSIQELNQIKI